MTTHDADDDAVGAQQFDDFIHEHYDALLGYAFRRCQDWHLAADLVQETFLKLWRTWITRRDEVTWHRKYAIVTLRHTHIDHVRQQYVSREESRAGFDESSAVAPATDVAKRIADRHELLKVLGRIPKQHREIYFLHKVGGFKPKEIGALLGLSARTVSNYICSAKREIATALLSVEHNVQQ